MNESLEKGHGKRFNTADTVQLTPSRIERAAQQLEGNSEFNAAFFQKVQRKLDIKDKLLEDDGTNNSAPWKRLGIFIVEEKKFPKEVAAILRENGIDIFEDETVLELHIPPQKIGLEDIAKSLVRLEQYLAANPSEKPLAIYGISYLAKFARRYGFELVDLPASFKSSSAANRLLQMYQNSANPKRREFASTFKADDIKLCYLTTDDFFDKIRSLPNYDALVTQNLIENVRKRVARVGKS